MATVQEGTAKASSGQSFARQFKVLFQKNALVQYRNKVATLTQVLIGVVFVLLLGVMDLSVRVNLSSNDWYTETRDPVIHNAHHVKRCEASTVSDDGHCYTFGVYGSTSGEFALGASAATIADVPAAGTNKGWLFINKTVHTDLNTWLIANPNVTQLVLEFSNDAVTNDVDKVIMHANMTEICGDLGVFDCEKTAQVLWLPMMNAVDSALARKHAATSDPYKQNADIKVSFKDFPHPKFRVALDVMTRFGASFFFIAISFNFVVQLRNLVVEKEKKLRDSMRQMGMRDLPYWLSWISTCLITNTLVTILLIITGALCQFDFFLKNDFIVYFFHFWLNQLSFTCLAFLLASVMRTEASAVTLGLLFFIIFFLGGGLIATYFYNFESLAGTDNDGWRRFFMYFPVLCPPIAFYQGFQSLVTASTGSGSTGMRASAVYDNLLPSKLLSDGSLDEAYWSLGSTWTAMFINCIYYLILAWYLDNVLPNSYGRRESVVFCLRGSYWTGRSNTSQSFDKSQIPPPSADAHPAVKKEAQRIINSEWDDEQSAPAVQVMGMKITFRTGLCGRGRPVQAVQGITYGVQKDSLFVLLGHNGAGKSTTINALVGNIAATDGEASIFGRSIRYDMSAIQRMMGVCPQHDVLWDHLTGAEHLRLFASLRGIPAEKIEAEVQLRLDQVNLSHAASTSASAYSGGMRRRLSIAIALIGDPRIVYLDEPTTGMDPVTRREIWDMIEQAKRGRVIILTTHSMEEADVLGDHVAIMSHGRVQAIGTSLQLKREFGGGFKVAAFVNEVGQKEGLIKYICDAIPGSVLESTVDCAMFFKVPSTNDELLIEFFRKLEQDREELGLADLSIGLTTLEEVFLELSKLENTTSIGFDPSESKSSQQQMGFRIPENATPGTKLSIPHPHAGPSIEYVVPTGVKAGDLVTLDIPALAAATGVSISNRQVAPTGDASAATAAANTQATGDDMKPGCCIHCWALCCKSLAYQATKILQICCVICFPVFIMLLLLLLTVLFESLRLVFVCGDGVSKADCSTLGYNLTCVERLTESTRPSEVTLQYGVPTNRGGAPGSNINPNCGSDSGTVGGEVCYTGLEKPTFRSIPMTVAGASGEVDRLGNQRNPVTSALTEWYQDVQFDLARQQCAESFDAQFDPEKACKDLTGDSKKSCNDRVNDLQRTRDYQERASGASAAGAGTYGYLSCLPDSSSTGTSTWSPTQSILTSYETLLAQRLSCESSWIQSVGAKIATLPASAVASTSAVSTHQGLLGNFTTRTVVDEGLTTITTAILDSAWNYMNISLASCTGNAACASSSSQTCGQCLGTLLVSSSPTSQWALRLKNYLGYSLLSRPYVSPRALARQNPVYFSPNNWHETFCKIYSSPAELGTAGTVMQDALTRAAGAAMGSLCSYVENIDVVRGTTFNAYASESKMRDFIFDEWLGHNVETPYMQRNSNRSYDGYRHHFYETQTMAFTFDKADTETGKFEYVVFFNNSATRNSQDGNWFATTAMMNSAILNSLSGSGGRSVFMEPFPLEFKCNRQAWLDGKERLDCTEPFLPSFLKLSVVDFVLLNFLPFCLMLVMYPAVTGIVNEKEHRLTMIMKMMGLKPSVYYVVTYFTYLAQYICLVVLIMIVGSMADVQFFKLHSRPILFLFFFVWGNLLIMFSFFLTTFFSRERTAGVVAFLVILVFWIVGNTLFREFLTNPYTPDESYIPLMFFPPWVMARWVTWFALAGAFNQALDGSNWASVGNGVLPGMLGLMILHWFVLAFLVWYLQKVLVVGYGTRKPCCFCLSMDFWRGTNSKKKDQDADASEIPAKATEAGFRREKEMVTEHERVMRFGNQPEGVVDPKIRIINMHKVFPASGGAPEKVAVKCVSLGVNERECLGLLGHNGAGKTTMLNMLTGLFEPTSGNAYVDQLSLKNDIDQIYARMGVCPQHDILWGNLNAMHHLRFFGRLKGFKGRPLAQMVKKALIDVNLVRASRRPTGGFSGGMKRRLSVANSLVGNPQVVYMDEPSTGLDPASRRQLWDVISRSKQGKSMILTTHSMEEADVLCDRIAIMADGALQCIGRSWELKKRFGKGYTCTVTVADEPEALAAVHKLITDMFPSAELLNDPIGGLSKYEIDRKDVVLSEVFEKLNAAKESHGIVDWGFTETTLEEVFLRLAKEAHIFSDRKIVATPTSAATAGSPADIELVSNEGKKVQL